MRQGIILIALAASLVAPTLAQTPRRSFEKGTFADLKGRTRVFVSAMPRDRSRARKVIEIIEEKLPGITLVQNPAEAEIWVQFYSYGNYETTRTPPDLNTAPRLLEDGRTLTGDGRTTVTTSQGFGLRGTVIVIPRPGSPKLIMEFSQRGTNRNSMAEKFASEFIRVYQEGAQSP